MSRLSASLCQPCIWKEQPLMMFTGFCLWDMACDRCHRVADLAMVKISTTTQPTPPGCC